MFKEKLIAEEISRVLLDVSGKLDESTYYVANSGCSVDEKAEYFKIIGRILGTIGIDVLNNIYRLHPDLKPPEYLLPEDFSNDGDMTPDEVKLAEQLSEEEKRDIDQALLANASHQWRKVARIVGAAMSELQDRIEGLPDLYYAQRIALLAEKGLLDANGDLKRMRFSEVRLKSAKQEGVDEN